MNRIQEPFLNRVFCISEALSEDDRYHARQRQLAREMAEELRHRSPAAGQKSRVRTFLSLLVSWVWRRRLRKEPDA